MSDGLTYAQTYTRLGSRRLATAVYAIGEGEKLNLALASSLSADTAQEGGVYDQVRWLVSLLYVKIS